MQALPEPTKSRTGAPLLSVVMPSFNQGAFIADALESVAQQEVKSIEVIVMDGGSTDETLSVLKSYQPRMPLVWLSAPDGGLYDALNNAIQRSSGEWVGWLNTDDRYARGAFTHVRALSHRDDLDVISGDADLFMHNDDGKGEHILKTFRHYRSSRLRATEENLRIAHLNACFLRRRLLDAVGLFDIKYRVCADRDYLLRLMQLEPCNCYVGQVTYHYRVHPGSLTMNALNRDGSETILSDDAPAWRDLRDICWRHMHARQTPRLARNWCRRRWSHISARQIFHLARAWRYRDAWHLFRDGLDSAGPSFLGVFVKEVVRSIFQCTVRTRARPT